MQTSLVKMVVAGVLIVVLVGGSVGFYFLRMKSLKREISDLTKTVSEKTNLIVQLQAQRQQLEEANQQWAVAVDKQNAQIQQLQLARSQNQKRILKELSAVKEQAEFHQRQADSWRELATSQLGSSDSFAQELEKSFTSYLERRQSHAIPSSQ